MLPQGEHPCWGRWKYNVRDCAVTIAAHRALDPLQTESTRMLYRAELALEACCLAIHSRGFNVDKKVRSEVAKEIEASLVEQEKKIDAIAGQPVNPRSAPQVANFLYEVMKLKRPAKAGGTGRDVLDKLASGRMTFAPGADSSNADKIREFAEAVAEARALGKDRSMLRSVLDKGRLRQTLRPGGTESFRFSSSKTNFSTGANCQQIRKPLRRMIIPDEGMVIVQGDQDRAESYVVAYLSGDDGYIKAHNAFDTHVDVAKMIWPDAGWTGDDEEDLELSQQPNFIGAHSRRDLGKRTQHSLNYYPPPVKDWQAKKQGPQHTLARLLRISVAEAYRIANSYFEAFPGIREWQLSVIDEVKNTRRVVYPGGFQRLFFGRPWDDETHREAISSIPQSTVAWTNHIAFFNMWMDLEEKGRLEVLHHNHDAIILQCDNWEEWCPKVKAVCDAISWPHPGGEFTIGWTWEAGRNWKEVS